MNHKRKEVMQMNKPKIRKGTIRRLLGYIKRNYMKQFIAVFICIVLSSIATVAGSLFLQKLIDDYITPLLGDTSAGFGPLLGAIGIMVIIYVVGITTSYLYNRIMAVISQGVLKDIRDEMFDKMEKLPIKYFDTHAHYNDEKFDGIVDDVLNRCKNIGVKYVINIGYNIESSIKAIELSNKYKNMYVAIGIHPSDVGKCSVEELEKIYNEYNNGLYLGNTENPYVVFIKTKSDNVTNVMIHSGTKVIYSGAFARCNGLTSVTIPDSVTSIGSQAFWECSDLTSTTFQGTMQQWKDISKGVDWNYAIGSYTVTCTDGVLDKNGQQIS